MKSPRSVVLGALCALLSLALPPALATDETPAARAASAPQALGGACSASAPSTPRATAKLRHVPDEADPCAGTRGIEPDGTAMPESLRRARARAASGAASAPAR